ncbi:HNH endonuclease [Clostridium sp.]|uniref:HNH endonuclease n=1 Tax=Clostridium sp. TaxID=1506 RepID=UPI0032170B93
MSRRNWTRDETILALYLYYEIPFGKIHSNSIEIIKLAEDIGRTPAAVAMKMCNLARFDETLRFRNVNGLKNGSKMDKLIWNEFVNDGEKLLVEMQRILEGNNLEIVIKEDQDMFYDYFPYGSNIEVVAKARKNQKFFRKMVLTAYNYKCCISNIEIPEFLIASHIKPWRVSDDKTEKVNPRNGLCLNVFYDKAFDAGYITVTSDFIIHVSKSIKEKYKDEASKIWLHQCDRKVINLPEKFMPEKKFLEYHNDVIFKR